MKRFCLITSMVLYLLTGISSGDGNRVTLSFGGHTHPFDRAAVEIAREAYKDIGVSIFLEEFPPERFQTMGNLKIFDGILFGGESISEKFTNLEKIPVPLGYDIIAVFTAKTRFQVKGWESLRPYRIGILIGMPEIQKNTSGMSVDLIPTTQQLVRMLERGRVDIIVLPKHMGLAAVQDAKSRSVTMLPGEVGRLGLYHYLTKGHPLIPRITASLREMEKNGRVEALRRRYIDNSSQTVHP